MEKTKNFLNNQNYITSNKEILSLQNGQLYFALKFSILILIILLLESAVDFNHEPILILEGFFSIIIIYIFFKKILYFVLKIIKLRYNVFLIHPENSIKYDGRHIREDSFEIIKK